MEILKYRIPYRSRTDVFKIYFVADQHIGSAGCDKEKILADIDIIKNDPMAYWIQGGDSIDAVVLTDTKRFDPRALTVSRLDDIVMEEADEWLEMYAPIANRCIGILDGNHEESIRKNYHIDIVRYLCKNMCTNYLGDVSFIKLLFERKKGNLTEGNGSKSDVSSIDIFAAHGNISGGGGRKVNKLEDLMSKFTADVYMLAHGHEKVTRSATKLSLNHSGELRLVQRKTVSFMTGSYLRTYQVGCKGYGEKSLYSPSDLGMVGFYVKPNTHNGNGTNRLEIGLLT